MNPDPPPVITPEPAPNDSLWSRMLNVYVAPGEAFDTLKGRPADMGNWLMPAILLMLVSWIGTFLIMSRPEITQQIQAMAGKRLQEQVEAGKISAEQAETMRVASEKAIGFTTRIVPAVGSPVYAFAVPFWWGFLLWLLGGKLLKGGFPYLKAVEIAGLSSMILVLEAILKTLLILATGKLYAGPGPVLLVMSDYDPQNLAHRLLTHLQVTTLWVLAVRAVGISRLGAGGIGRCAAAVFGFWILWSGFWMVVGQLLAKLGQMT